MLYGQELLTQLENSLHSIAEQRKRRIEEQVDLSDSFRSVDAENWMERKILRKIDILNHKGYGYFRVLADLKGNVKAYNPLHTRFGYAYYVDGQWISTSIKPETMAKKGYKIITVKRVAWVSDEGNTFPCDTNYWTGKTKEVKK